MLPQLTRTTALGPTGIAACAARRDMDIATFLQASGPAPTVQQVGTTVAELIAEPGYHQDAFLPTAAGLGPLP